MWASNGCHLCVSLGDLHFLYSPHETLGRLVQLLMFFSFFKKFILGKLKFLSVANTKLTDKSVHVLANFTELVELNLERTKITDRGMVDLKSKCTMYVTCFDRKMNILTLFSFGGSIHQECKSLKRLSLAFTEIGDDSLAPVHHETITSESSLNSLLALESLDLCATMVTDLGVGSLRLPELEILNLDRTFVTARCKDFLYLHQPKLKTVRMNGLRELDL